MNQLPNNAPIQPAIAASEWRQCDALDAITTNHFNQSIQPAVHILDLGFFLPMLLRRKIDDKFGSHKVTRFKNEHPAWFHLTAITSQPVFFVVLRETLFELERDA